MYPIPRQTLTILRRFVTVMNWLVPTTICCFAWGAALRITPSVTAPLPGSLWSLWLSRCINLEEEYRKLLKFEWCHRTTGAVGIHIGTSHGLTDFSGDGGRVKPWNGQLFSSFADELTNKAENYCFQRYSLAYSEVKTIPGMMFDILWATDMERMAMR